MSSWKRKTERHHQLGDQAREFAVYEVTLTDHKLQNLRQLAKQTYLQHEKNPHSKYENTLQGHLLGHMGEGSAAVFFVDHQWECQVVADDRTPDLRVRTPAGTELRIACKTWNRNRFWVENSRCIRPEQRESTVIEHDAILWLRAMAWLDKEQVGNVVDLVCWSLPSEIPQDTVMTGPPLVLLKNHRVPLDQARDMSTFISHWDPATPTS